MAGGEKVVRMGVIGVGGMGQGHCKTMQKVEEMKLCAVCDFSAATAEKVGKEHNVPYFSDPKELIKAKLCDAVLIATPHPVRPPIAIEVLKAGLHLLSEKPLSENVATADKMIAMAKKKGVAFGIMFQRRTEPPVIKALELIRGGELGKLYRRTLISPEYRSQAYYDSGGWRATWKGEGGGVMMNQAPHVIDLFLLLGGMPNRVIGNCETRLHRIEVEDHGEAMLFYPDGGTGYMYTSTCEAGPGQMIELFGDKGKLCWRNGQLSFWKFNQPIAEFTVSNKEMWAAVKAEEVKLELTTGDVGHVNIHRNFARHILNGEPLVAPGEEGIRSLELANAVWLSSFKKKPIDLPISRSAYNAFLNKVRTESTFVKEAPTAVKAETDPQHAKA
ncbi:MAG: hypothetical protein A3K19_07985 [Lentisphaerae bacterium RIFOXYB12_FULL_65_16]|nr:MAG: hypothetical protein A3K18_08845 [Lentisphaerae bacterium RIFOXYA12_64_32]OGV87587.1 MAG: hypothetical protein A3K19_07985 [Lentisphaerae bacterium RIFOXYB12_FULL_65_16]